MFALKPPDSDGLANAKTFTLQRTLPRLPIPALEETLARYLQSLEPILLQAEEMGQLPEDTSADQELEKRRQWASEALREGTLLRRLQQCLYAIDQTSENNWLDDRFWIQKAYLERRDPLILNSNCWSMLHPDPDTPAARLESANVPAEGYAVDTSSPLDVRQALGANDWTDCEWGIRRATWLTYRLLLFKQRLEAEAIPPDASRAGSALCMRQYRRFFGITRIPGIPCDALVEGQDLLSARHILVLARNNLHALNVVNENGEIVALPELERALTEIRPTGSRSVC